MANHRSARPRSRVVWAVTAAILGVAVSSQVAAAIETQGCVGAVEWRILAEVHRSDGVQTFNPASIGSVSASLQGFADFVGIQTGCAVRIRADVIDAPQPWPIGDELEDDLARLAARPLAPAPRAHDLVMLLRPHRADDRAVAATDYTNIVIPFYDSVVPPEELVPEPNTAMSHEWLHILERHYPRAPWPDRDPGEDAIHEQPQAVYPFTYEGVLAYHGDLLGGRVDGALGMRREDWASQTLPRDRVARGVDRPAVGLRIGDVRRRARTVAVAVTVGRTPPVRLALRMHRGTTTVRGRLVSTRRSTTTATLRYLVRLPSRLAGTWRIVATAAGSRATRPTTRSRLLVIRRT